MRVDLCLSRLCLLKTRSQVARACQEGRVWVNGQPARPSREVRAGDVVRFRDRLGRYDEEVEILELPQGNVPKSVAREMVRLLGRRTVEEGWSGPPTADGE